MDTLADLRRRFDYHFWSSEQLADTFSEIDAHRRARGYLAHAVVADWLWLQRIEGLGSSDIILFPNLSAADIRSRLAANAASYGAFLSVADLSETIAYANTAGMSFENSVGDILNHILLHGMYHRGQAASALRAAGTGPPQTDYIKWARS